MSEFKFESFAAEGDAGQLMSEAVAEDGLASHEAADVIDRIGARLGISGAVGEEDSVRFQSENIFCGSLRGNNRYPAALAA